VLGWEEDEKKKKERREKAGEGKGGLAREMKQLEMHKQRSSAVTADLGPDRIP
jgi:hypothetical protein